MEDRDKTREELLDELGELRRRVRVFEESSTQPQEEARRTQAANVLLRLFATATSRQEYLQKAVTFIKVWSDCHYVGIRVLHHNGEIPYEAYLGYSRDFWESENWLSIHRDHCACIRVITGKPEAQDMAVMTRGGSFYLDNSFQFLHGLTDEQRARYRGMCVHCGFKSIGIIPISVRGKILGLIHIADGMEGKVTLKLVEFLESVAFAVGQAIQRFATEEDDRVLLAHFRWLMESSQDCVRLLSLDGACLSINTAGYRLHRFAAPEAVLGQSVTANVVDNRDGVAAALRRAAAGEEVSVKYQTVDGAGGRIWWDSRLTPVRRTDGSIRNILSIAQDITARGREV